MGGRTVGERGGFSPLGAGAVSEPRKGVDAGVPRHPAAYRHGRRCRRPVSPHGLQGVTSGSSQVRDSPPLVFTVTPGRTLDDLHDIRERCLHARRARRPIQSRTARHLWRHGEAVLFLRQEARRSRRGRRHGKGTAGCTAAYSVGGQGLHAVAASARAAACRSRARLGASPGRRRGRRRLRLLNTTGQPRGPRRRRKTFRTWAASASVSGRRELWPNAR